MKELKKIVIALSGFFVCILLVDFGVGRFFDYMMTQMPPDGERVAKSYHSFKEVDAECVIIGSSRAETGYVSTMLMDSLDMSVFNCGGDGQDFFYGNTLINCLLDRYSPKMIIWDFKETQLGGNDDENLSLIYPYYYENEHIRKVLDEKEGVLFKYMIWCNAYRYNATAGRILRAVYTPLSTSQNTYGFGPRQVSASALTLVPKDKVIEEGELNAKKVAAFEATAKRVAEVGCQLYIVISPMFNDYNEDNCYTRETRALCERNGAIFIDDSHMDGFKHNADYAYDTYHLNVNGAKVFTEKLIEQIRNLR